MRRLFVLVLVLGGSVLGVNGCTRSGESPLVAAGDDAVVAGGGTAVFPPPSGSQTGYAVAWDGTNYLVVWADVRGTTGSDVRAARVSPAGTVVDAAPIVVSAASGDQILPSVAFDGTNYLVVWQDHRDPGEKSVRAARVSPAGTVLDPGSIEIPGSDRQTNPAVAFDGTNYLVVWEDQRTYTSDVWAARVSPGGAVLSTFAITTASGQQVQPSVGCAGGICLAAWRDQRNGGPDVYGARISGSAVLDPAGLPISRASSSQGLPAVAGDGTRFLVAWSDTRNGTSDVYGARVGADGVVADPTGVAISTAPGVQQVTAVAHEGRYFVVVWEDGRSGTGFDVYGARVGGDAAVLDPGGFLIEARTSGTTVGIASDGVGRTLVASDVRQVVDPTLGTSVSRLSARILVSRAALTVFRSGSGSGTVTSVPAGIDCGTLCSAFFDAPADVNLTPTAAPGSAFVGWSGACSGSGACTVAVNDTRTVDAKFSLLFPLSVTRSGTPGSVVSSPAGIDCGATCSAEFVDGTSVELTPVPGTNSLFGTWSGPCQPTVLVYDPLNPPSCLVRMTQAAAVSATFRAAYKLTVNATGTAAGTVDATPTYYPIHCATGSTAGCSSMIVANEPVTLTATPAADVILKSWTGCNSSSGLQCNVALTYAKTVTATFQPAFYTLKTVVSGNGTVSGTGISCTTGSSGDCSEQVANGGSMTVVAAPDPDWIFKSWSGCTSVSGTSCTVSMTLAKTVTATFQPARYPLTLNSTGGGGGTVFAEAGGFTCAVVSGVPCGTTFANGETVVLTASPDASSVFKSWTGCSSVSGTSCTVTMTSAKTLTVKLEPSTYPLSVAVNGSGSVAGAGIACGTATSGDCSAIEPNGEAVTLTATPAADAIFKSWSGCTSVSGTTCNVTMTAAKTVTATFQPAFYTLTTVVFGSGTISGSGIACGTGSTGDCTEPVANGGGTTLTATPEDGAIFKSWSGCSSVSGTTCNVSSMSAAKSVTATFQPAFFTLTTVVSGSGTISGSGIACSTGSTGDCTEPVANGGSITVVAAPDADWIFKSWSGCTSVSGTTCNVSSMSAARSVTATFQPARYPLTLNSTGGGGGTVFAETGGFTCAVVSGVPCGTTFANGETVVLTASPDASSLFKSWTGCSSVSGTSCTVTMTSAKTLTVKLEPSTYALNVAVSGNGSVEGPGIACGTGTTGDCSAVTANGASVTLVATPAADAIFKSWSGCSSVSGTSCTVSMTAAKTVTATFQPANYLLTTVAGGTGRGTISGPGIDCATGGAGDCTVPVANGGSITVVAAPDADSIFKYWSGCSSVSGTSCTVSMTAAKTVTATFQPANYLLTTVAGGTGTGTISGPGIDCATGGAGDCSEPVANGGSITVVATPGADSIFKYWSGCSSVSGTSCTVSLTGARTVTATFQPATYPLTVTVSGSGTVEGAGILCTGGSVEGCGAAVANGATVTLTATPADGALFRGWTGCSSASGTTCTVNMTAARTVTASF